MTFPSPRLATVGLLAAGRLGLVAACGDEDDGGGSSDKLVASCKAHAAVSEGFTKFFTKTPALQGDGPPPKSATPQIRKDYDKFIAKPIADFRKDVPKDIASEAKGALAAVKKVREGDVAAIMSRQFATQVERIDGYYYNNCDDEKTEVEGPDYSFENLDDTYSAGFRRFKLQNTGMEVHEMVILEKKPGITESFDRILKLPESKARSKVADITAMGDVNPGKFGYTSATLHRGRVHRGVLPSEGLAARRRRQGQAALPAGHEEGVQGRVAAPV